MPKKSSTKLIVVYITDPELYQFIADKAESEERSLSDYILRKSNLRNEFNLSKSKAAAQAIDSTPIPKKPIRFD